MLALGAIIKLQTVGKVIMCVRFWTSKMHHNSNNSSLRIPTLSLKKCAETTGIILFGHHISCQHTLDAQELVLDLRDGDVDFSDMRICALTSNLSSCCVETFCRSSDSDGDECKFSDTSATLGDISRFSSADTDWVAVGSAFQRGLMAMKWCSLPGGPGCRDPDWLRFRCNSHSFGVCKVRSVFEW